MHRLNETQNQRIIEHIHLVPPIVSGFMSQDSRRPRADVESDGQFGLVMAALTYDENNQAKASFETWASNKIRFTLLDGARRYFGTSTPRLSSFNGQHTSLDDHDCRLDLVAPSASPEKVIDDRETVKLIMGQLDPRQRHCAFRYYVEDAPMAEIAKDLGVVVSTVSRTVDAARWLLRNTYLTHEV